MFSIFTFLRRVRSLSTVSHSDAVTGDRFSVGFLFMSDGKMEHLVDRQDDIQRWNISLCEKKLLK